MNISSQAAGASIWQRIKVQHIALVCGLAVAAAAALAVSDSSQPRSEGVSVGRAKISAPAAEEAPASHLVFFIAGSQEQADGVAVQIEAARSASPEHVPAVHFFIVNNAEEEVQVWLLLAEAARELAVFARHAMVEVVDLRNP